MIEAKLDGNPEADIRRELEAALLRRWADDHAWSVYADWLQARGDAWGQRIGLELVRNKKESAGRRKQIDAEIAELTRRFDLLGPALRERSEQPGFAARVGLSWSRGFVVAATLTGKGEQLVELAGDLDALLASPAGRFVRLLELELDDDDPPHALARLIELFVGAGERASLHELHLVDRGTAGLPAEQRDATRALAGLRPLLAVLPELRRLVLAGSSVALIEPIEHEWLEYLAIDTGGLPLAQLEGLSASRLPKLRRLVIRHDTKRRSDDPGVLLALIERAHELMPELTRLELTTPHSDAFAEALSRAPMTAKLRGLQLNGAAIRRTGGAAMLANIERFYGLEHLSAAFHGDEHYQVRERIELELPGIVSVTIER